MVGGAGVRSGGGGQEKKSCLRSNEPDEPRRVATKAEGRATDSLTARKRRRKKREENEKKKCSRHLLPLTSS